MHEFWRSHNKDWRHNDLTAVAGAPLADGQPAGFAFDVGGSQFVHYRGVDAHLHQLQWTLSGWQHLDLTVAAGAPAAASGTVPTGYVFGFENTLHVDYLGAEGHIHELWRDERRGRPHRPDRHCRSSAGDQ